MTDADLTRWRLLHSSGDATLGRGMKYFATAPGCVNEFHRSAGENCDCQEFGTAFEARLFIRDSNRALDAENHLPDAS